MALDALGELESFSALEGGKNLPSNLLPWIEVYELQTSDALYTFTHVICTSDNLPFYKYCS